MSAHKENITWEEAVIEAGIARGKYWSFQDIYPEVEALKGERWGKIANPEETVRASVYALRGRGLIAGDKDTYTVTDEGRRWLEARRLLKDLSPEEKKRLRELIDGRKTRSTPSRHVRRTAQGDND